jgi:PAS domain S-box-containing protein
MLIPLSKARLLLFTNGHAATPAVVAACSRPGRELTVADNLEQAAALAASGNFAAVLAGLDDVGDPALARLGADCRKSATALLVLGPPGAASGSAAYAAGAVDVLPAPLDMAALEAKLAYFCSVARRAPPTLAEARLRLSEQRYRTLFDAVDEGVCVIDMLYDESGAPCDYRFLETNPAFVSQTGLANAVGKTIRTLAPGHEQHWFRIYGQVARTGEPVRFIDEARALGRWFDVCAVRLGEAGSNHVAVLFKDISERVRTDAELRRLAHDLAETDRRKTEFLATLAHELRNPLAPIRSGLQVLRMQTGDTPVRERVQDIIDRQLDHMVELVDDLLDVARITRGQVVLKPVALDLRSVLDAALEPQRPLFERAGLRLTLDAGATPLPLQADPLRLAQVIGNVLGNAAKFTPRGGHVHLAVAADNGEAVLAVADDGIGIDAADLEAVFDMFSQAGRGSEHAQGGLGIGLALARNLTELHGGRLSAASPGPGRGSTFTLRLPLAGEAAPASAPPPAPPPAAVAPLRILVVDDNRDAAETLSTLTTMLGHATAVAHDGAAALALAGGFQPDLVLLDLGMPGLSGFDVARQLRATQGNAALRLVALTGWGSEQDRARTAEAGFDLHLTKPVTLSMLSAALAPAAPLKSRN